MERRAVLFFYHYYSGPSIIFLWNTTSASVTVRTFYPATYLFVLLHFIVATFLFIASYYHFEDFFLLSLDYSLLFDKPFSIRTLLVFV